MDKKSGLIIIAGTSTLLLCVLLFVFRNQLSQTFDLRTICVASLSLALLVGANFSILSRSSDPIPIRYIVAFNSVIFVIVGLTASVLICQNWQITILLAGACLLVGGFVGLLFGYPQGVAQKHDLSRPTVTPPQGGVLPAVPPQPAGDPADPAGVPPPTATVPRAQNLVADSAATLGKVITGFTLAKLSDATHYYEGLIRFIGPALGCPDAANCPVVAGVLMAYFLATGFLSGLFLPSYFMGDVI